MGLFKIALIALPILAMAEDPDRSACTAAASMKRALSLSQSQSPEEAISRYQEHFALTGRHDFEALQRMGLMLLRNGIQNEDPNIFTMTLFGAGLSGSSGALEILERGLRHPDPQLQMISLHFIK